MNTLLILRHAKSSWKDPDLADHERPLSKRGRRAAKRIGAFLREMGLRPQLAWCSTAARARETLTIVLESARLATEVHYDERIYGARVRTLLDVIAQTESGRDQILVVGHNPEFEELLLKLTGSSPEMPPAALAKVCLEIEGWSELAKAKGSLEWLVKPKDLSDS
jgi:phosphohistidine phosphatase